MAVLRFAHTPDHDDAYMFYGIAIGAVKVPGFDGIKHIMDDIESLNKRLVDEGWNVEVSAASAHAFPFISDRYYLMRAGASMGEGYGPVVVSRTPLKDLKGKKVAIPGKYTTARLILRLATGNDYKEVFARFDKIPSMVISGDVDAGLLIHEAQVTYRDMGLRVVLSLWDWWKDLTGGLPMPLGVDVVHKSLGIKLANLLREKLQESIAYAWKHHEEALEYAISVTRSGPRDKLDKFIRMYVNERTLDMGSDGIKAHEVLYKMASQEGFIPENFSFEVV